jgi:uncharacterized protein (DUF1501 family)
VLTRRGFLAGGVAVAAAGACSAPSAPSKAAAAELELPGPVGGRQGPGPLVLVTLVGGNDALNTVVPVGDPRYAELRGGLGVDPAEALPLDEGFALHPSLARCKELWDGGRLAVVHGVGFERLDRSHFHCMDVWHAGGVESGPTGWIGRWLDATGADPLAAVAVGDRLPLLARGERTSAAVVPPGPFDLALAGPSPPASPTRSGATTPATSWRRSSPARAPICWPWPTASPSRSPVARRARPSATGWPPSPP